MGSGVDLAHHLARSACSRNFSGCGSMPPKTACNPICVKFLRSVETLPETRVVYRSASCAQRKGDLVLNKVKVKIAKKSPALAAGLSEADRISG